jgi:esterase/lipase
MDKIKPTILFLHGALGTAEDLSPLMTVMKERGFETLSFTFSGHGVGASEPEHFRIDHFAHDLENFLKRHHLKSVIVFGYSMGGYVALYHKVNFEDSPLKKIFTYGTKFNWSEKAVSKEIPMLNPDHLSEKFQHFAEALKTKHGERWKQVLRSTAHMMQNLERLDGLTREDLADIDVPVILILGDQDRMVTTEETLLTSSWIAHSQTKTISHSKHELERSNLREIASVIEENLE